MSQSGDAKKAILASAIALAGEKGLARTTIEQVAKRAGCAKGLVPYHFKTKAGLQRAVSESVLETRITSWRKALTADRPASAVASTWSLLVSETRNGTLGAWIDCTMRPIQADQSVRQLYLRFTSEIGNAAATMLRKAGFELQVQPEEIGSLLVAAVDGLGLMLIAGLEQEPLEAAYSAAWLGILALVERKR